MLQSNSRFVVVFSLVVLSGARSTALRAQTTGVVSTRVLSARNAAAPKLDAVTLIVRPRVGDTLHLQMEQSIEMSGRQGNAPSQQGPDALNRTRVAPAPRSPDYGPRRARASLRITRVLLYAHSFVEASDLSATTLLATTDSMAMWAGSGPDAGLPQAMPLPLEGRQIRVRVTPDGTMRVNDPPPGAMELGATLASMPGMLPDAAVRVGDRWERDILLPSLPVSGFRADGVVRAQFRLDSLTHAGRNAWISMLGTLRRDGAARELPAGTRVVTAGTMRGTLLVDRDRAWIMDARTDINVQSEVSPGPAGTSIPMLLDIRIVQRVRVH